MEMEEKIINELKPKSKPQQLLRDWQRRVTPGLHREEENVHKTIKKASKRDDIGSSKTAMDVDAKDIRSDLYALKRLYGLLKKDGDETSDTVSNSLDEHARVLLKNLLDAEAKRALKLHAEMIAGQVEAQLSQSCRNDLVNSDKDKTLNRLEITLRKENRSNPQGSRAGDVEQSEQRMVGNGPEYQNKRCRVCRRNTLKRLDSIENAIFYDVGAQDSNSLFDQNDVSGYNKDEQKIGKGRQSRPLSSDSNSTVYTDVSSDMMVSDFDEVCNYDVETTNKPDELDRVSEEASEVIKQIELCISAFQIGADHLHLFEGNSAQRQNCVLTKSVSPAPQTRYGAVSRAEISHSESSFQDRVGYPQHQVPCSTTEINLPFFPSSHPSKVVQPSNAIWTQSAYHFIRNRALGELGESTEEHKFPVYKANNFYGQDVNAIIDKIDPVKCIISRNETSNGTPSWPVNVIIDSTSRTKSPCQRRGVIEHENNKHRQFRSSDSFMHLNNTENARSVDSGLHVGLTSGVHGKRPPPQLLVGPGQSYAKHKNGNPKNRQHYMTAKEKLIQHQEPEGTPADSYSSNSISHQTSSGNSDSEECSSSGGTRKLQYASRSTSNECGSPLSQGSESQYSSYSSTSENEVYSSTPSGSSNSDASSSYSQPIEHRAGPTYSMSNKSGNEVKHKNKKQNETWKKLKDGLAIIFHHHHHHHHHHNQDDNEAKLKNKERKNHFKREDEANGERAVEKAGKAMVRDKDQKAHFHGLMEGLLRHVRRSKKSKIWKETAEQLGKGQNRKKKKSLKKSQWLKLLQHHRAASKAHVKLGFGKKRTRLKALPNLE